MPLRRLRKCSTAPTLETAYPLRLPIPGLTRVTIMEVLGIFLTDILKMTAHCSATISTCTRSIYALKTLRSHRLSQQGLHDVCRAITISKLMNASFAWWGYTSASDKSKIESMISKCMRLGYLHKSSPSALSMASHTFYSHSSHLTRLVS